MEAVSDLAGGLSVRGGVDIRMEAAMAKLFGSEASERIADLTLQIRGGRGYEQEGSLRDRGEIPFPVERIYRDARINTIVEGTSDVMHLFIAREALDPHLSRAGALVDPRSDTGAKMKSLRAAMAFYPGWYATRWFPGAPRLPEGVPSELTRHLKYVHRSSRRLARSLFHAMVTVGPKLERRQELLARFVDIGVDLFAMSAAVSRATSLVKRDGRDRSSVQLADHFCRVARRRIAAAFLGTKSNDDRSAVRVTESLLDRQFGWLETGIVTACPEEAAAGGADPARQAAAAPEPAARA
jgi:hypothetical protein